MLVVLKDSDTRFLLNAARANKSGSSSISGEVIKAIIKHFKLE
jgi:hypothetical protein